MSIFNLPADHWLPVSLAVTWGIGLGGMIAGIWIHFRARRARKMAERAS